jgi:hypothetical protein
MKTLRDLQAAAQHYRFSSEATLDQWLTDKGVRDPETRIALKHYFEACGKLTLRAQGDLATDQSYAPGTLATDRARVTPVSPPPTYPPGMSRVERLLQSMGVTYPHTLAELETKMTQRGLDATEKIACKLEAQQHQLLKG